MEKVTEERLVKAGWDEKRTIDISNIKDVYQKLGLVMPMNVEKFLTVYGMHLFLKMMKEKKIWSLSQKKHWDAIWIKYILKSYWKNMILMK